MIATGAASAVIMFMSAGAVLTVLFFVVLALVVVGYFKPSPTLRRAGWVMLGIWIVPAAVWSYYLMTLVERDQYRTLTKAEVVYGIPLPAGSRVNYHRWARAVQWATLPVPQMIQGIDYKVQVTVCGGRVCGGTLARDQEIQGIPCLGGTEVKYSDRTGRLIDFTVAGPWEQRGVTWPAGTEVTTGPDRYDSYMLPEGAAPVRIAGMLVHSGLIVDYVPDGPIYEMAQNAGRSNNDTRLEVGDIILKLKFSEYRFEDGVIRGGVLDRAAVIDGKSKQAGDPVVIPQPPQH